MNNKTLKITIEQRIALAEVMREMGLFLASKHVDLVAIDYNPYNSLLCLRLDFFDNVPSKEFLKELFWLFVYNKINSGASLPSANHITECLEINEWAEDDIFIVTLSIVEQGD